jgi:sortase A
MKDHRYVDDLDVEELERVLLIKRREARLDRVRKSRYPGDLQRRDPLEPVPPTTVPQPVSSEHQQYQGVGASASYHSIEVDHGRQWNFRSRLMQLLSAPLRINWRFISNKILLLIEITAVVGLVLVVLNTWQTREEISEDVEALVIPPTQTPSPTPVPIVNAVVLPGGHTAPDIRGFSQPVPIPENLRVLEMLITPQPVPTRGPEQPRRLVIPSIGVDHPIVAGDDWDALKQGIGHTIWSANPGEDGNCVLSAHNDIFGAIFQRLPDVELGDEIVVHTDNGIFAYVVKATHIVEPTQVDLMDPTIEPRLTLISSYPYLADDKRIVVVAELAPAQGP